MKIEVFAAMLAAFGAVSSALSGDIAVSGLGKVASENRRLIQEAVNKASADGGGRVTLPKGTWPSGSIELKSGVELHLPKGAVLKGSTDRKDYNANDAFPENAWNDSEEWSGGHLVWARCAEKIAITGEGTVDGNGPAFFGECDEDSRWPWYKYGLKLHPIDREWFRPGMMVAFFRCRDIRLEGVTLANTTAWTCHLRCCDGAKISGVTIDADRTIANSDGFSIDCTRNVKVEKCTIRSGDDGFAIRASCRHHASTNFCENIEIRDCDVWTCCSGIRFGIGTGTIRKVTVENLRIHEAADDAFGFTPAWVDAAKNCYIEDVEIRNCHVRDCVRAMSGWLAKGDSRIMGILFENCTFETLLPFRIDGSPRLQMTFRNCERRPIERVKVRHRWQWNEQEIRNRRFDFADVTGKEGYVKVENCRPEKFGAKGVLALSFDDRNFDSWEAAMPIFEKYGAHATFFVSGEFDARAVKAAKRLMAAGHSIGLHGINHANAPSEMANRGAEGYWAYDFAKAKRQCDVAYVPVRNFAYPNCAHDDASDKFLLGKFDRLRAAIPGLRPYDPKGEKRAGLKPLATDERVFFPVSDLPNRRVLRTILLGEAYNTDIDDVVACIKRAGERKETLIFASHGIMPDAKSIHLKTEWLEKMLKAAKESNVAVLSYDELPLKRK